MAGQKGTAVIVKSGTGIWVDLVETPPSELTMMEVVTSGQVIVEVADKGNGGRIKVQGVSQEILGES